MFWPLGSRLVSLLHYCCGCSRVEEEVKVGLGHCGWNPCWRFGYRAPPCTVVVVEQLAGWVGFWFFGEVKLWERREGTRCYIGLLSGLLHEKPLKK